jgi:hypothetical protein
MFWYLEPNGAWTHAAGSWRRGLQDVFDRSQNTGLWLLGSYEVGGGETPFFLRIRNQSCKNTGISVLTSVCQFVRLHPTSGETLNWWYMKFDIVEFFWSLSSHSDFEERILYMKKTSVFWDVTPCSPIKLSWRFGGTFLLSSGSKIK